MEKGIAKDNNEKNEYSGWPLCLEPMNIKIRLLDTLSPAEQHANAINLGSSGFSSISSSNLETERSSSSSFCHNRTITLGEILGMSVAGVSTRFSARFASTVVNSFRSLELNECVGQSKKSSKKIWKCIGMWCYDAENEEPCYARHSHEKDVLQMYEKVYTNAIFEEDSYKDDQNTSLWANHPMIDVGQYWSSESESQNEKGLFTVSSWSPSDLPVRIDMKPYRQRLSTKILRKFGNPIARSSSFF